MHTTSDIHSGVIGTGGMGGRHAALIADAWYQSIQSGLPVTVTQLPRPELYC